jgi:hypothetical protein
VDAAALTDLNTLWGGGKLLNFSNLRTLSGVRHSFFQGKNLPGIPVNAQSILGDFKGTPLDLKGTPLDFQKQSILSIIT